MRLLIDRAQRDFVPVDAFRAEHGLPAAFGVAHFEPQTAPGPHWADGADIEMDDVRAAVLEAMPAQLPLWGWPMFLPTLVTLFQNKLDGVGAMIGMDRREIMLAVNTFTELCQKYLHAMIRARVHGHTSPAFDPIYAAWLDSTVEIGGAVHPYTHQGDVWAVQVVSHAFGKAGLIVWTDSATHYVEDTALCLPVQAFLERLLRDVSARMVEAAGITSSTPTTH